MSQEEIRKLIRQWKHAWAKEPDYRHRAYGIDANMVHDLARMIFKAQSEPRQPKSEE